MTLCGVGGWVGWGGWVFGVGWVNGYDQLCCPASPKLLLGLDLGLGCNNVSQLKTANPKFDLQTFRHI